MHSCAVPDYRSARVFLAGDAAHLCSAAGGFGMNAGIHDAVNLAWRLTAHLRLNADDSILDGYNTDRREMFDVINAASDANHTLWTALDREDRVLGMRSLPSAAIAAAARDMGEVSFSYRNDSMWFDQAEPSAIHAGMRMPPAADMGNGDGGPRPWSSLYDGRNWTFVLAVADRTRAHAAYLRQLDMVGLAWLNARTRFVLCVGDVFAWTAPRPTLYVIRPDGYIAFRLDADPDTLPEISVLSGWLATTFGGSLVAAEAAT
jgi:hypothetical protein